MILGGVALANIFWALTFGLAWGNFWPKIGISVTAVCLYSLLWQKPAIKFNVHSVIWGILTAAALYGIFFIGNSFAPYLLSGANTQISDVYAMGSGNQSPFFFLSYSS
jgi:hypothetical protein